MTLLTSHISYIYCYIPVKSFSLAPAYVQSSCTAEGKGDGGRMNWRKGRREEGGMKGMKEREGGTEGEIGRRNWRILEKGDNVFLHFTLIMCDIIILFLNIARFN